MRVTVTILLTFLVYGIKAQNYTRDGGIRAGDNFSIGYRQFLDDEKAVEAWLSAGRRGARIIFLKQHIRPALGHFSENMYLVLGYGAHAGFRYSDRYRVFTRTYALDEYRFMPLLGLDGLIALEYRFPQFPVLIGLDFKPYFEYSNIQIFNVYLNSIGFSVKYRF